MKTKLPSALGTLRTVPLFTLALALLLNAPHAAAQDDTVTLRDRDSMRQERIAVDSLKSKISEAVSVQKLLKKI